MHLEHGKLPLDYSLYSRRKTAINIAGFLILCTLVLVSISVGAVPVPLRDVFKTLFTGGGSRQLQIIILSIRLPQALTAVVAGAGLAISGTAMQSVLRNPLGSPYTLGVSNAAGFGAAFAVMILNTGAMHSSGNDAVSVTNPYLTTAAAFTACLLATGMILFISGIRRTSPEVMILAGVAMGSLFTAGTMFLQYFADDVQLAAMVFWTFGDLGRASCNELLIISSVTVVSVLYFLANRWNYNAIDAGDETARGLGVPLGRIRLTGMLVASLVTATIISFVGVIGFVGLVCPHFARLLVGDDHRFLLPGSMIAGAILLLAADTVARLLLAPHVLPVAIITAFVGAPLFAVILVRGYRN